MSINKRKRRALLLAGASTILVGLFGGAAGASAAPVATVAASGSTINYTAVAGKTITPLIVKLGGAFQVTESGVIADGDGAGGCTLSANQKVATCPSGGVTQINATGSTGADRLVVYPSVSIKTSLGGGAGKDALTGGLAADTINGGDGNDVIYGVGGGLPSDAGDTIDAGPGNDTVDSGSGDDVINGGTGPDELKGGSGVDVVDYTGRTDSIELYLDVVVNGVVSGGGSQDNDPATQATERDTVDGFESIYGGETGDHLQGSTGANTLAGNGGDDWLYGDSQTDWLLGGAGSDVLQGGDGLDYQIGAQGNDIYMGTNGVIGDAGQDVLLDGGFLGIVAGGTNYFLANGDGQLDQIGCGPNEDHVWADTFDLLAVSGITTPAACVHVTLS